MSVRSTRWIWLAIGIMAMVITAHRLMAVTRASGALADELARSAVTKTQIARLNDLTASRSTMEVSQSREDILGAVNDVLADVDVPGDRMQRVVPESDRPLDGSEDESFRIQQVRVVFSNITPGDLGLFLNRWDARAPLWVPIRIELRHAGDRNAPQRYDVTMLIANIYSASTAQMPAKESSS